MKKLAILAALLVAGCAHHPNIQTVTTTKLVVVKPDPSLINCPTVDKLPNGDTLTDSQVAGLVTDLWEDNHVCKNNMDGIKQFYDKVDQTTK